MFPVPSDHFPVAQKLGRFENRHGPWCDFHEGYYVGIKSYYFVEGEIMNLCPRCEKRWASKGEYEEA